MSLTPANMAESPQQPEPKNLRERLAVHRFNQKEIMNCVGRRNMMIVYHRWQWQFMDPKSGESLSEWLTDDEVYPWLAEYDRNGRKTAA